MSNADDLPPLPIADSHTGDFEGGFIESAFSPDQMHAYAEAAIAAYKADALRWRKARDCMRLGPYGQFVISDPDDTHDDERVKREFDIAIDAAIASSAQPGAKEGM